MTLKNISKRKLHFGIITLGNIIILIESVSWIYHEWNEIGNNLMTAFQASSFLLALGLISYSWRVILFQVLNPLNRIINTLHIEAHFEIGEDINSENENQTEIEKLSHVLNVFRENSTKLKTIAENLERQKSHMKTILAEISDVIITIDTGGTITMTSPAIKNVLGYDDNELIGKPITVLMTKDSQGAHDGHIQSYLKDSNQESIIGQLREVEIVAKSGKTIPMELLTTEIKNDVMHVFVAVMRDISIKKELEEERKRYLAELENSNQELNDFAYIASHDLKEPLRGLQSFSQFLLEDYEDKLGEDGKKKLHTISELVQKLEARLNALLEYSRLGRTEFAYREEDLNVVVNEVVSMLALDKSAQENIEITKKLPIIKCDHAKIGEVFHNLIGNAIKYSEGKNKIEIGFVENHPRAPGQIVFFVKDQGIGIEKKFHESIFKIFKRLHGSDAYGGGTGSGLTIVKKIITRHNGEVWVESEGKGKGSTFFFTIPQNRKGLIPLPAEAEATLDEEGK